jgi:hypothetical protein
MKKITGLIAFWLPSLFLEASPLLPPDTTFQYNNKTMVITNNSEGLNISVFQQTEQGDTLQSTKIYEGIYTDSKSIERQYETHFEICIPDIFKPKHKRHSDKSHWSGFGVGFSNLPEGLDFGGELASSLKVSRSLQYNLNLLSGSWRIADGNCRAVYGMGIQFNSIHFQANKAIEVHDFKSVITTTEAGQEYNTSRLHYTCLTFPLLVETSHDFGEGSHFFINAGIVGKVKTASSSKIWRNDANGNEYKTKLPGDLNIRPVSLDFLIQAGINDFGIFASYAPFELFMNNKGPKGNQTTIGIQCYF